jgi:ubiquinone/menaquinone biosynthesis C-methylase UbiE
MDTRTAPDWGRDYVQESRFGFWFLGTLTWEQHVVKVAIEDLQKLMPQPAVGGPIILDVGCGQGKAAHLLQETFKPRRLIGLDFDGEALSYAQREAAGHGLALETIESDCAAIPLPDGSVDMVFCHQTLHHLVRQEQSLAEFRRVLRPGGQLLLAESTREYINSWVIRLLFRHPMDVQHSAEECLEMLRRSGFAFGPENVSFPYLWWSRARDFGLLERWGIKDPPPPGKRKETLLNVVAVKPV